MANNDSVYKEVWNVLSKVDVKEHIETKAGLSYLSWAWAWGVLMKTHPDAEYLFMPEFFYPDGSCKVECIMDIRGKTRSMWLPVMDYRNKAIENPTSRDISDARMRCLVKCIAMWGLGHYIYAGEDLPQMDADTKGTPDKKDSSKKKESKRKSTNGSGKSAIDIAVEELEAKVIPNLGRLSEVKDLENLRKLFDENKEDYAALGDAVFKTIREDFNKKRAELKKESN